MVDPIGPKPGAAIDRRIAPVTNVTAPGPVPPTVQETDASTLRALSQPLAAAPPVDLERVAKIRKAIADGTFPLVPSTVADRLLALKLQWKPSEPS